MFHKPLFILTHEFGDISFYHTYNTLVKNQWNNYNELKKNQEKQLKQIIYFCYNNVPFYRNLFKNVGLLPSDIQTHTDLEKLPLLTKDIIKKNWEDLKPVNLSSIKYYNRATGGSTGTPFQYRLAKHDRFLGGAILYRGWSYGGYKLGDRMLFLGGSSLDYGKKNSLYAKINEITRNIRKLSSFDMEEPSLRKYVDVINSYNPRFIRGYATSIFFFSRWLEENNLSIPAPHAIFTTAEKLFPQMRKKIEEVFDCDVFDTYGLNDGGISAFECQEHSGLHIDTERSIMEVTDESGMTIEHGKGQIIATSLHNYAMPFIRYVTGDEGFLSDDHCPCQREYPLLKEIIGRQQEILITPEGKRIHGEFFTHIFWGIPHVREFQVVQKDRSHLQINIVPEPEFDERNIDSIRSVIKARSNSWDIQFNFVDTITRTRAGKYKFVINEVPDV